MSETEEIGGPQPPEPAKKPIDGTVASQCGASQADDTGSNGGSSTASGYVPPLLPYDVRRPPFELIMRLQQERSSILAEVSHETQERDWFQQQVDAIEKRVEEERKRQPSEDVIGQLRSEADRVTHSLRSRFGSEPEVEERRQTRLRRIHDLDLAMLRLQQASAEDLSGSPQPPPIPPKPSASQRQLAIANRERAEGSETSEAQLLEKQEQEERKENRKTASLVTTATQTNPADLSFDLTLPDILLRDSSSFPHSPSSPFNTVPVEEMTCDLSEPNVSSAGQTCKLEVVYSLLSMLGTHDTEDLSRTLLAMTSSTDSCHAMRQSGCLPLLVQLLHGSSDASAPGARGSKAARRRASQALRNLVSSNPDERAGRREMRVLRLLEQLREYCDQNCELEDEEGSISSSSPSPSPPPIDPKPGSAVAALMKLSFNSEHQHAICTLGGVQAIAELMCVADTTVTARRYACMALTNLSFGDGANKALLCSLPRPLRALVSQLASDNEDLQQVAASVIRNLSWRADLNSKRALRDVAAPECLIRAAMRCGKETTLKSVLSALWNLSAHCTENKTDICAVEGALRFLVSTLSYKSPSKSLAVIENGGGILRNTSSVIALRDEYRDCLRSANCLPILLRHLRSPSLTVVSNACGTLWNLSASCPRDQQLLWELGAVPMLRSLVHSKHKMISMGSASALKNLLSARPNLHASEDRRKKEELTEGSSPSSNSTSRAASTASAPCGVHPGGPPAGSGEGVPRSSSKDSVHSDQTHDRLRHVMGNMVPSYPPVLPFTLSPQPAMTLSAHYNSMGHPELTMQHCLSAPNAEEAKTVAGEWQSVTRGIEELQMATANPVVGPPASHRLSTATNEDQEPLTFCTEGTPYGVSTAASVSDLLQVEQPQAQPCPPARPHHIPPACVDLSLVRSPSGARNRLSRHRASVTSADGNESDANSEKPQDFGSRFGEGSVPTANTAGGLPVVSPRTYAVEDTPVTGGMSRCSSLSSISELDEAAGISSPPQQAPEKPISPPNIDSSPSQQHHLERIEERASSEAREAAATVHKKTVTFVCEASGVLTPSFPPTHEETPLMFSRSSSLSSLGSSLGERSIHSSVVSEYSRSRNSEVVSPSDLPDSPTASRSEIAAESGQKSPSPTTDSPPEKHDEVGQLLSQVIESALPGAGKQPEIGVQNAHRVTDHDSSDGMEQKSRLRATDCMTLYATEDTPQGFSTMASSLSDLTVDSRAPSRRSGRQRGSTSEAPVVYATEGTPALYSYTSPLSSLFMSPVSTGTASPVSVPKSAPLPEKNERSGLASEDRSSLSSLSLDSAGLDRSLLEECISSALPKMPARSGKLLSSVQRSSGVGSARPARSCTMPAIPTSRLARLPQPSSAFLPVNSSTVGRLSRKEAASKSQSSRHQTVGEPIPVQRSRSAGATLPNTRVDIKVTRLPPNVPTSAAPPTATSIANQVVQAATNQQPTQFWGSAPISPSVQVKAPRKSRMHKSKSATEEHGRRRSSSNTAPGPSTLVTDLPPSLLTAQKGPGWRNTSLTKKKKRPKGVVSVEVEPPPSQPPNQTETTGNFLAVGSDGGRRSDRRVAPVRPRSDIHGGGVLARMRGAAGGTTSIADHRSHYLRGYKSLPEEDERSICEVTYSLSTASSDATVRNENENDAFAAQLWAELEMSLEIDAADCHKSLDDTDNDVDSDTIGEGLDAFSSSSSSSPSPVPSPSPPVRRARIVKPEPEPPKPVKAAPIVARGRHQRSENAVKRPSVAPQPTTPVRLTKSAAQRMGVTGRTFSAPASVGGGRGRGKPELNNNLNARPVRGRASVEKPTTRPSTSTGVATSASTSPSKVNAKSVARPTTSPGISSTSSTPKTNGRGRKPVRNAPTEKTPVKGIRGRGEVIPRIRPTEERRQIDRTTRIIEASDVLTAAPVYCTDVSSSAAGGKPQKTNSPRTARVLPSL